jgi:hypothetical protein
MKLLVDSSLTSYATPAIFSGFSGLKHDPSQMSTFDTFDKVEPDVYIADADLLTESVFKNIEERPALKFCVLQRTPTESEHPNFIKLKDRFGDIYNWILEDGHADLLQYRNSEYKREYKCDIVSIEDNPISGIEKIKFKDSIKFRIFSEEMIKSQYYCGFTHVAFRKDIYKSSKLSISSGDNVFNSIICDCFPVGINDPIEDLLNTDHSSAIKEMKERIYADNNHFISIARILDLLGMEKEAKTITEKLKEIL